MNQYGSWGKRGRPQVVNRNQIGLVKREMTMKKLFVVFVAVLFVVGLTAGIAYAKPDDWFAGIFEAPFVADEGTEFEGSEGKIGRDGSWKVEIPGFGEVTEEETYQICLETTDGTTLLRGGVSVSDSELKEVCIEVAGACSAGGGIPVPSDDHQAPRLQVREEPDDGDCDGDIVAESGLTVNQGVD